MDAIENRAEAKHEKIKPYLHSSGKPMIRYSVLALTASMMLMGCQHVQSDAEYVRANHCIQDNVFSDTRYYNSTSGKIEVSYGWKSYRCPNGVDVIIENNEAQP